MLLLAVLVTVVGRGRVLVLRCVSGSGREDDLSIRLAGRAAAGGSGALFGGMGAMASAEERSGVAGLLLPLLSVESSVAGEEISEALRHPGS